MNICRMNDSIACIFIVVFIMRFFQSISLSRRKMIAFQFKICHIFVDVLQSHEQIDWLLKLRCVRWDECKNIKNRVRLNEYLMKFSFSTNMINNGHSCAVYFRSEVRVGSSKKLFDSVWENSTWKHPTLFEMVCERAVVERIYLVQQSF